MSRIPVLVAATAAASFALVGLGASPVSATCANGADDWPTCTPSTTLPASTTTEPTETSEPSSTTSTTSPSTTSTSSTSTTVAVPTTIAATTITSTSSPTTSSPPTSTASTEPPATSAPSSDPAPTTTTLTSCSGICGPATVETTTTTSLLPPVTDTLPIAPTTEPAPETCVLHDGTETTDYELANGPIWLGETRRNVLQCNPIVTPTTPNQPPATTGTPTASTPGSTTPDKPELPATGTTTNVLIAVAVVLLLAGVALYAVCYWLAGDVEGGDQ